MLIASGHPPVMLALLALPVVLGAAAYRNGRGFRKGWGDAAALPNQVETDR
jgi:hypothetical protein